MVPANQRFLSFLEKTVSKKRFQNFSVMRFNYLVYCLTKHVYLKSRDDIILRCSCFCNDIKDFTLIAFIQSDLQGDITPQHLLPPYY